MKLNHLLCIAWLAVPLALAQTYHEAPPEEKVPDVPPAEWLAKIEQLAPAQPTVTPERERAVLVFSLTTGFQHQVRAYVSEMLRILGRKSGAFTMEETLDIECFTPDRLAKYDAVILNNNCPDGKRRDIFYDVLNNQVHKSLQGIGDKYGSLSDEERERKGAELERNLLDYVASGKGLVAIHGAIALQINSAAFSDMLGGSFDFHPPREVLTLELVEPSHPLVAAFGGRGFVHSDELYLFKNAYAKTNFRPLLEANRDKLDEKSRANPRIAEKGRLYVSWIKPYGKGRVFYVGPSHQPQSYEHPAMLRFHLDGIQYALGDLKCDDAPLLSPAGGANGG
jgi:uncharacterized protein